MGAKRLHPETAGQPQNRLQKYYTRDILYVIEIGKTVRKRFERILTKIRHVLHVRKVCAECGFLITLGE